MSTNGTDWEVVDSFSGTTGVGYVQYRTDLETLKSARYAAVRSITPNGPAQPGGQMVVTEFEVYELASPEVLTPSSPTLTGLDITPDPVSLMAGLSQALTVKAKYSDNNETDVTGSAIYSTDNSSIATVSSAGNVASVAAGTTSVTAAFGGKTKTVQVTVTSGNNGTGNGSNGTETGNGSNGTGTGSSGTSGGNGSGSGLQPTPTRPVFNDKVDPDVVRSIVARGKNASAVTFTDVAPSSWSAAVIENAARMGIVSGFANGAFKPDANVTRAEFATMLVRAFGLAPAGSALFKDTQGHWAANAIAALNDLGIISGYGDGTFRPDQPISRAEIVVMLARLTNYVPATTSQFSDVESNWAADAIGAFAAAGIVSGKGEGKFAPASSATRAESVAILVRLLEKLLVQE
ncbi:S-layer homology domain-containing protein [Cohnella ginsengisoli]|uniref:S-layer homology domain-containing protein n=1 Tax=Cohnella ginsengisoli TaxID=425004 RepID=A0A9X4KG27_9BACL|nr:S-layer homology domain-containing protein [Cohnella ginsengisoli]MDG0791306.1 S-layer homology domain-containing protein [Cohnella ginsengisoli]